VNREEGNMKEIVDRIWWFVPWIGAGFVIVMCWLFGITLW
jgi:hypothetical protein